jgi:hypothetical protein
MIEVVNVYLHDCRYSVSIMRGTPYGNPFIIGEDGTREEVVEFFREYAEWRIQRQPNWLRKLKGVRKLKCVCAPQPCHGHVIAEIVERIYGEKESNMGGIEKKDR